MSKLTLILMYFFLKEREGLGLLLTMLCGQVNSARLVIHVHIVVLSLPSVPLVPISLNQLSRPARHAQQVKAVHQCYIISETCIHPDCVLKICPFLFQVFTVWKVHFLLHPVQQEQ